MPLPAGHSRWRNRAYLGREAISLRHILGVIPRPWLARPESTKSHHVQSAVHTTAVVRSAQYLSQLTIQSAVQHSVMACVRQNYVVQNPGCGPSLPGRREKVEKFD